LFLERFVSGLLGCFLDGLVGCGAESRSSVLDQSVLLSLLDAYFVLRLSQISSKGLLRSSLALLLQDPVILTIKLPAFLSHQTSEKLPAELIVGFLLKLDRSTIVEELVELVGQAPGKFLDGSADLLLLDLVVFDLLVFPLEALPRQGAFQEVHHYKA